MHEVSLLENTNLWYAVSVVAFLSILIFAARKGIAGALDGQIAAIRGELDEAKRLRAEAEKALTTYQARQNDAMQEAEAIVAEAKALAARLRREAELELQTTLKRQEELALDRIAMAQEEAAAEVHNYLLGEALGEVRKRLEAGEAGLDSAKMIDAIIADLPKLAKKK